MTKTELRKLESDKRRTAIEKAKKKNDEKLEKWIATEAERYQKFREDALLKENQRRDRKRMHRKNKITRHYDHKTTDTTKKVRGQVVVKRISTTIRQQAIREFQKRIRIRNTNPQ